MRREPMIVNKEARCKFLGLQAVYMNELHGRTPPHLIFHRNGEKRGALVSAVTEYMPSAPFLSVKMAATCVSHEDCQVFLTRLTHHPSRCTPPSAPCVVYHLTSEMGRTWDETDSIPLTSPPLSLRISRDAFVSISSCTVVTLSMLHGI